MVLLDCFVHGHICNVVEGIEGCLLCDEEVVRMCVCEVWYQACADGVKEMVKKDGCRDVADFGDVVEYACDSRVFMSLREMI